MTPACCSDVAAGSRIRLLTMMNVGDESPRPVGSGKKALEERPKPDIVAPTDAIARIAKTTNCDTDLHALKGDVRACRPDRILAPLATINQTYEGRFIVITAGPETSGGRDRGDDNLTTWNSDTRV
jgi:hypothetical protein